MSPFSIPCTKNFIYDLKGRLLESVDQLPAFFQAIGRYGDVYGIENKVSATLIRHDTHVPDTGQSVHPQRLFRGILIYV